MAVITKFSDLNKLVGGVLVHSDGDNYGRILVVDYSDVRVLRFDSIYEQSAYRPAHPHSLVHEYTQVMMLALAFTNPHHVTLFGLGGGALLRSLHHFFPDSCFHVVELRPLVYHIAKSYFAIPDDGRVRVSIGDAAIQMRALESSSTNVIFSDLYNAYGMSPAQSDIDFVRECWRVLSSSGCLAVHCHRLPAVGSSFYSILADHFPTIMACPCALGSHILFACKTAVNVETARGELEGMQEIFDASYNTLFRRVALY